MGRNFYINGEVLVRVKGTLINATMTDLGLCSDSVTITPNFRQMDIAVDAWGGTLGPPPEIQWMLADVQISMTLVHFDIDVLKKCQQQSMGGAGAAGTDGLVARAGTLMGGGTQIGSTGNNYISLLLTAPIAGTGRLWHFPTTYMTGPPLILPLGVQRSLAQVNFRAIPYPTDGDPAGAVSTGGTTTGAREGATGVVLWNHTDPG